MPLRLPPEGRHGPLYGTLRYSGLGPIPAPKVCQWPFGHPGEAEFHFCGKPNLEGRSYCAEHWPRTVARRAVEELEAAE